MPLWHNEFTASQFIKFFPYRQGNSRKIIILPGEQTYIGGIPPFGADGVVNPRRIKYFKGGL